MRTRASTRSSSGSMRSRVACAASKRRCRPCARASCVGDLEGLARVRRVLRQRLLEARCRDFRLGEVPAAVQLGGKVGTAGGRGGGHQQRSEEESAQSNRRRARRSWRIGTQGGTTAARACDGGGDRRVARLRLVGRRSASAIADALARGRAAGRARRGVRVPQSASAGVQVRSAGSMTMQSTGQGATQRPQPEHSDGDDGMHALRRAEDRVDRAGLDAERAADAARRSRCGPRRAARARRRPGRAAAAGGPPAPRARRSSADHPAGSGSRRPRPPAMASAYGRQPSKPQRVHCVCGRAASRRSASISCTRVIVAPGGLPSLHPC